MKKQHYLYLLFYCFVIIFPVLSNDNKSLINDLNDLYNAFHINHVINDQHESIERFVVDMDDDELDGYFSEFVIDCKKLFDLSFNNDTLTAHIIKYLNSTIYFYQLAKKKDFFSSSNLTDELAKYNLIENTYLDYLYSRYSTDHFLNITQEEYWLKKDRKNFIDSLNYRFYDSLKFQFEGTAKLNQFLLDYSYISSNDYNAYDSIRVADYKQSLDVLKNIIQDTDNFQEKTIYQIELADQYVKYGYDLNIENARLKAIDMYRDIISSGQYSIYLFDTWVRWRVLMQKENNGSSTWSFIPNDEYNRVRKIIAKTTLDYIHVNYLDQMAINQFLLIASHDIIRRFGNYPYGNQSIVEYLNIFSIDINEISK